MDGLFYLCGESLCGGLYVHSCHSSPFALAEKTLSDMAFTHTYKPSSINDEEGHSRRDADRFHTTSAFQRKGKSYTIGLWTL